MMPTPVRGFGLVPKVPMLWHFVYDMKLALQSDDGLYINPAAFSCDMNEDLIGKVCRVKPQGR